MPIAFLLINVDKGSESEVLGALKKLMRWKKPI